MRILVFIFSLIITTSSFAVTFEGKFVQGSFILGKTEADAEVFIDKKKGKSNARWIFCFWIRQG